MRRFRRSGSTLEVRDQKGILLVSMLISVFPVPFLFLIIRDITLGPTPFLNLTFQAGNKTWNLALEPFWIRITTPFTNPYLFVVLAIGYIIGFAFFARAQSFQTPTDAFIDCTSVYWVANDGCGLNGENCAAADDSTFDFRCPAQCNNVILQNPRTIGDGQLDLVPLIVGGGDANGTYRGDTFICAAAVQAYV